MIQFLVRKLIKIGVAATAPNYTAECLNLVKKKADFIELSVAPQVGARVVADCVTQGYKGYFEGEYMPPPKPPPAKKKGK